MEFYLLRSRSKRVSILCKFSQFLFVVVLLLVLHYFFFVSVVFLFVLFCSHKLLLTGMPSLM